jgi:hypothetical protein
MYIDAQGGEMGGGGTSCTPSKDFEKFGHKYEIKHENRGPPRFSHNPMCTPSQEFENDCASMLM